MKKGKLLAQDGSEFTVFFHKSTTQEKQSLEPEIQVSENLNEMDVNAGACCSAQPAPYEDVLTQKKIKDELSHVKDVLQKDLQNFLKKEHESSLKSFKLNKMFSVSVPVLDEPFIDDTIEKDIIREPVVNQLYRIRGLNKIARFKGHSLVEGVHTKRYFQMSHHGQEVLVTDDSLIEAKEIEVNNYMGKTL